MIKYEGNKELKEKLEKIHSEVIDFICYYEENYCNDIFENDCKGCIFLREFENFYGDKEVKCSINEIEDIYFRGLSRLKYELANRECEEGKS